MVKDWVDLVNEDQGKTAPDRAMRLTGGGMSRAWYDGEKVWSVIVEQDMPACSRPWHLRAIGPNGRVEANLAEEPDEARMIWLCVGAGLLPKEALR